jgi:hypothetical protein
MRGLRDSGLGDPDEVATLPAADAQPSNAREVVQAAQDLLAEARRLREVVVG